MDFELTDEQKDIQKAAAEFARGEFDQDLALELDQDGAFPEAIWKKAVRLGFIGIHYPEEFGGQGFGLFENLLVIEAFCRVDSGIGSALSTVDLGSELLLKFGSDEQKRKFLPPLVKGAMRLSVALAESEDPRDFVCMATVAERRKEGLLVRGKKRFVPNASLANVFIVLCKDQKEGWITLLAEKAKDGIEVSPVEKMGLRMISFGDLYLREVTVPQENWIEGDGLAQVEYLNQAMGLRSLGQAVGVIAGAFDRAAQYARQREQFGRKLLQFQAIRHKLADMAVGMEVARLLTYRSALLFDHGEMNQGSLSMTCLEVGGKLLGVVDEALQIFGGYGYMTEQAVEHYYRDAWAIAVDLGTKEEHRDEIARRILGAGV